MRSPRGRALISAFSISIVGIMAWWSDTSLSEIMVSTSEKKLLTYPRTDSRYLTSDMAETASCVIHLAAKLPPFDGCTNFFPLVETMISDKDVSDHHAINPTM